MIDKAATLDGAVHAATWAAASPCRIRLLPAAKLGRLIDEEPLLRAHVLRHLAGRVNSHRRSRIRRAAPSPLAQVADWLAETATSSGRTIVLVGGQQGLGDELGLSRVTVNRALRTLALTGAVRVRPGNVQVLDAQRLASHADRGGRGPVGPR